MVEAGGSSMVPVSASYKPFFKKKIKSGNYKHIKKNVCTVKEKISFLLLGLNVLHDFFFFIFVISTSVWLKKS